MLANDDGVSLCWMMVWKLVAQMTAPENDSRKLWVGMCEQWMEWQSSMRNSLQARTCKAMLQSPAWTVARASLTGFIICVC